MQTGIMANVLEVLSESYEFTSFGVEMTYCVVMDRNTGKCYITGEEGIFKTPNGFYYEALECEGTRDGRSGNLVTPLNSVYIAPIYMYGKRLGYVFGKEMIDYKG